jgi:catechol 2,3-dioxygenase-like lactoylglutathione lyase family enzyme
MRIHIASVFVDDQDRALSFYTDVLGFRKQEDIPLGEYRWITVVAPGEERGTQLLLEPDAHPAVRPFKDALAADGIPFTSFAVDDVESEHDRLVGLGVRFTQPPTDIGPATTAVFDDTCGNLIAIVHQHADANGAAT